MAHRYFHVCRSCMGKAVMIRTRDGGLYRGRVGRVTSTHVYMSPIGRGIEGEDTKSVTSSTMAKTAETTNTKEEGSGVYYFTPVIPLAAILGLTLIGTAPYWGGYGPYGGGGFY
jgi:hypothetical protein